VTSRLRSLLRHFGFGERRWIAEPDERHRHTELVRSRLPVEEAGDEPMDTAEVGTLAGDSTDSVISEG
jgi:hypothetical protein